MTYLLLIHILFHHLTAESINCKKFGPHCEQCNENSCTSCMLTTVLDEDERSSTYGHCLMLKPNCIKYSYQNECELCNFHFGVDENGDCKNCDDPNCYDCTANFSKCASCDTGYGFDRDEKSPTYGKCLKNKQPHCTIYNRDDYTKCAMCRSNYFLNHSSGKCQDPICRKNCSKCTSLYDCEECSEGFGKGKGGRCQQCKDDYCGYCYITSNFEKCSKCKNGLYQVGSYNHVTNTGSISCFDGIMDCSVYEKVDKCKKCLPGKGLDEEFKCQSCQDENCTSCLDNYKICTECKSGTGLDINNHKCYKCKTENCKTCYKNYTKCDHCNDGYKLDEDDFTCHKNCFDPNCVSCDKYKSCYKCKEGYSLIDNKCTKCEIENCINCSTGTSRCEKCKDGFKLSGSKCVECAGHCNKCDTCDDPINCTKCIVNYGFMLTKNSKDFGKCVKCNDKYCQYCNGHPDHCNVCMDGYKFINGRCSPESTGDDDNNDGDDNNGDGNTGNENSGNNEEKDGGSGGGKLPLGAIIGIAVGGVVVVGVIIGVTVFCVKKKTKISNSSDE